MRLKKRVCLMALLGAALLPGRAYAVVGQAEEYDYFEQKQLDDFHDRLVNQELYRKQGVSDDVRGELKRKTKELKKLQGEEKDLINQEIEMLKRQLLELPKRDRFRIEGFGSYSFDTNANRQPLEEEKNDSLFNAKTAVLFDLSGKKTDLRLELNAGKSWSIEYPEKDSKEFQEVVRYRRRYFKKINQSIQSRLMRHNSKTVEIDSEKIRYDSSQNSSINYAFNRRLSINNDTSLSHRQFPQEAFDNDSSWESTWAPSAFWSFTPKSRIALGYRIGNNRIRSKSGNAVAHEIHAGYFGRITRKSSASLDLAFSHQDPRSLDTDVVNTVTSRIGYILQLTPKTQALLQYIYSVQNTTANSAQSGVIDAGATAETVVAKSDARFYNNSISLALNSRLNPKLTGTLAVTPFYMVSQQARQTEESDDARRWGLPVTVSLNYVLRRWLILTSAYTFAYVMGDEHTDRYRSHQIVNSMRLIF